MPYSIGILVLLKRKVNVVIADAPLPTLVQHSPSQPPHPCKCWHLSHEVLGHMKELLVKYGVSNLTRVQIGQDQHRIDITNECLEKALVMSHNTLVTYN